MKLRKLFASLGLAAAMIPVGPLVQQANAQVTLPQVSAPWLGVGGLGHAHTGTTQILASAYDPDGIVSANIWINDTWIGNYNVPNAWNVLQTNPTFSLRTKAFDNWPHGTVLNIRVQAYDRNLNSAYSPVLQLVHHNPQDFVNKGIVVSGVRRVAATLGASQAAAVEAGRQVHLYVGGVWQGSHTSFVRNGQTFTFTFPGPSFGDLNGFVQLGLASPSGGIGQWSSHISYCLAGGSSCPF